MLLFFGDGINFVRPHEGVRKWQGRCRFGDFELDVTAYELRRLGRLVRIERIPMELLILLLERRGDLVSREEIVERLWGKQTFVDAETGVNSVMRKVRQALKDSTARPVFIQTISGKGYRFLAPLLRLMRSQRLAAAAISS